MRDEINNCWPLLNFKEEIYLSDILPLAYDLSYRRFWDFQWQTALFPPRGPEAAQQENLGHQSHHW